MTRRHQTKPGGPTAYWAAMRALTQSAGGFTTHDIAQCCKVRVRNTVTCYLHACAQAGHIEIVGERPRIGASGPPFKLYVVKVTAPEAAPFEKAPGDGRFGAAHQQMWTAMRGLQSFTTRDLAAYASTDEVPVTSDTARTFVWKLEQAGYIQQLGKNGRWRVLRLKPGMSTGPAVPAISSDGAVVDRNPRAQRRGA